MAEIADRIAAVRKEAENLKELVKQKRDSLADTTRKFYL
jgi:guanine nucleotide-binding protein G(I)/G(S)/G(T) subunit beta-1